MTIHSDRGDEYLSTDFMGYLSENGILSHLSTPGMPQQNGVIERRNRTLLHMVRSMMSFSGLSISFWGYALVAATYILNIVSSKSVPKTHRELRSRRKPSLQYLHV